MATTPNLEIFYPEATTLFDWTSDLGKMATSIDESILRKGPLRLGYSGDRMDLGTAAPIGTLWQDTDGIKMLWRRDNSAAAGWAPAVMSWKGSTTQRNTFEDYAPEGFSWFDTTSHREYRKYGSGWADHMTIFMPDFWKLSSGWAFDPDVSPVAAVKSFEGVVTCYLPLKRTGAKITSTTSGNLENVQVASIPEDWAPHRYSGLTLGTTGKMTTGYVNSAGTVLLTAVPAGHGINQGEVLSLCGTWLAKN